MINGNVVLMMVVGLGLFIGATACTDHRPMPLHKADDPQTEAQGLAGLNEPKGGGGTDDEDPIIQE